ncbi:DUF6479 family protein [Streptomyces sp. NPDC046821]|uniref:DUF6479 family protein n=1 Tax=Streptomyces sp. NPDC046821 TaxID=3154702 RepID=UPI0033C2C49E
MITAQTGMDVLAAGHTALAAYGAFFGGLVIAGALVWAVRVGIRVRNREPGPPDPDEQPKLPETGPVREEREIREPDEVPHAANESERMYPYELHHSNSRRSDNQEPRHWRPGSSGGFGSGGPGGT